MSVNLIEVRNEEDESFTAIGLDIVADGKCVGFASLMVGENSTYIERIDIDTEEQGNGYGTQAIKAISRMYETVFAAPDNSDSQRLFERLGREYTGDEADYIDQGYGVYEV